MQIIKLNKVKIQNFKGIAMFEYEFNGDDCIFMSKSGEGKTSIQDAIKWCFGLNVPHIFPVINEKLIENIPTKVELDIAIDNLNFNFIRVSKQKIKVDKFDTSIVRFEGNESKYFIDGAEYTLTQLKKRIEELLSIPYEDFTLLLDIKEFNNKDWKFQRKWLFEHCNVESKIQDINKKYDLLEEDFAKKLDETDIQSNLNSIKVKIRNRQQENIREVDRLNQEMQQYINIDFDGIEKEKKEIKSKIAEILNENNTGQISSQIKDKLSKIEQINASIEALTQKEAENKNATKILDEKIRLLKNSIPTIIYAISKNEDELNDAKIEQEKIASMEFDEKDTMCKMCGQKLPNEKINQIKSEFLQRKEDMISANKRKIEEKLSAVNKCEKELDMANEKLEEYQKIKMDLFNTINKNMLEDLQAQKEMLQKESIELATKEPQTRESEINAKVEELQAKYDECVSKLSNKQRFQDIKNIIASIKAENLDIAEDDQKRVLKQNQLNEYIKTKIQATNDIVSSFFDGVSFKFFELNTDLAEKPFSLMCSVCFEGKEYDKQSTGQKIMSDIIIQNGIQKILGVNMFMFIDEAGSTSYNYERNSQTITLLTLNKILQEKGVESNFSPTKIESVYTGENCFVI